LIPGRIDVLLFDVTTLHFESVEVDTLRKFGYSKSFRFNTTQVVLALASTSDGLPIGYELFDGSTAEVNTLTAAIDSWRTQFDIDDVCVIGDRAMLSEKNLAALDERGYRYIVAAKLRSLPQVMMNKVSDESRYDTAIFDDEPVRIGRFRYEEADLALLTPNKNGKVSTTKIKAYRELIEHNKYRKIVVSYSPKRAGYDQKQREIMLTKINKQLDKQSNSAKLISNAAIKKYTSVKGSSDHYIDQDKVEADAHWDGLHGVITNLGGDVPPQEVLAQYRSLVKIEDCFRVNKHTLKMRPIYHFKPERIRAHIAICYMAFAVVRQLEYRVRLLKKLSIRCIIEELNSVQSSVYVHKVTKDKYRMPGSFSHAARKIYAAIGVQRQSDPSPIL
jgi:transposase